MPTITATAQDNGTITPSGAIAVTSGEDQLFKMVASDGYKIKDVKVDSVSQGLITEYTFQNVTVDGTIDVEFEEGYYKVTAEMADDYFANTLRNTDWNDINNKTAALYDGGEDIRTILGRVRVYVLPEEEAREVDEYSDEVKAVCEWGLFLVKNQDLIASTMQSGGLNVKRSVITGVGSEEYSNSPGSSQRVTAIEKLIMNSYAGKFVKAIMGQPRIVR